MLREASFLLKPGFYTYDPLSKSFFAHGYRKRWEEESNFFWKGLFSRISDNSQRNLFSVFADAFFYCTLLVPVSLRQRKRFRGVVVLRGSNTKVIKIFDYSEKTVATWFPSCEMCGAYNERRLLWQAMGFNVIPSVPNSIYGLNTYQNIGFEKYIYKQSYDQHLGLNRIFKDIVNYQKRNEAKKIDFHDFAISTV